MFQFEVHGVPVAQKQTRVAFRNGSNHFYDPSSEDKLRIQWQIKPTAPKTLLTGPVELTIVFFMPIPKKVSSMTRRQMINRVLLPNKKPDEDNMAYIITNALKMIVYEDDKQVCVKHVYKFYGEEPKTVIRVREILQMEPVGLGYVDSLLPIQ